MKKDIEVATQGRGFLNELFDNHFETFGFVNNKTTTEITGQGNTLLRRVFYSRLFDLLGIIQIVDFKTNYDGAISYNRFLNTNKPYYIICENPTALYHYRLDRKNGLYAHMAIKRKMGEDKLKGIICMSKACYETFESLIGVDSNKLFQIYPLIKDNKKTRIPNKQENLKCLYVSSAFELKSGCEIVEAAKTLSNIEFTIITRTTNIPDETKRIIDRMNNIRLLEFNLNKAELNEVYDSSDLLLHPSRQDSLPMTVLEAIKHGLPVLATGIYAIPEMVEDNVNGYLIDPKYWFFDKNNMPNPSVWNHRDETIYSHYIDQDIVHFLVDKINYLDQNRNELERLSLGSQKKAESIFSEERIKKQWEEMIRCTL